MKLNLLGIILLLTVSACSVTPQDTLFARLGGKEVIDDIAANFTRNIGKDTRVRPYFAKSSVTRFRTQFALHLCVIAEGPCDYTGDDMKRVHDGMMIQEGDFNHIVHLLYNAMDEANISTGMQNEIIARLAPLRKDIVYR
jgi:hemoglobin